VEIVTFETERDFALYVTGETEAFERSYPGVAVSSDVQRSIANGISGYAATDGVIAFTALDPEPVGFVVLTDTWFHIIPQCHIISIFVVESARGRGVGRLLLDHSASYARARGARTLLLDASIANAEAVKVYQAAGFVETRVQMEKSLAP
jgi:ribosomal protein S18 acetylase RimI-like enzyme